MKLYNELSSLKTEDYPAYLTILLTQNKVRAALSALFMLNVELKKIPLHVPFLPGLMRLRWWQDQILSRSQEQPSLSWLHHLPVHTPWEKITHLIQGHEDLLQGVILTSQDVQNLALNTDIPLLESATSLIHTSCLSPSDEESIHKLGLCLMCCYLYRHRSQLNHKDIKVAISDEELMMMIAQNLPLTFTSHTRWMAPLAGYVYALYQNKKKERKPTLFELQWHMILSYIKAYLAMIHSP